MRKENKEIPGGLNCMCLSQSLFDSFIASSKVNAFCHCQMSSQGNSTLKKFLSAKKYPISCAKSEENSSLNENGENVINHFMEDSHFHKKIHFEKHLVRKNRYFRIIVMLQGFFPR